MRTKGAGLGTKGSNYTLSASDTYKDAVRKAMFARFTEIEWTVVLALFHCIVCFIVGGSGWGICIDGGLDRQECVCLCCI